MGDSEAKELEAYTLKLLSCNNAGRLGGTISFSYSVIQSLPAVSHHIHVVGQINESHWREIFGKHQNLTRTGPGPILPSHIEQIRPDFIILNNTSLQACPQWLTLPTLFIQHSANVTPAPHHHRVFVSEWLREQCRAEGDILIQGVPGHPLHEVGDHLVVGVLAVPESQKWSKDLPPLLHKMSVCSPPKTRFVLVGCPPQMRPNIEKEVSTRECVFHAASWGARDLLPTFDFLVHANKKLPESFGRVLAEAMRAGVIPLVDDAGAFKELVPDVPDVTAPMGFRCSDEVEFVTRFADLADEKARDYRIRMHQRIAERANKLYSHAAFGERLKAAMKRTVECACQGVVG